MHVLWGIFGVCRNFRGLIAAATLAGLGLAAWQSGAQIESAEGNRRPDVRVTALASIETVPAAGDEQSRRSAIEEAVEATRPSREALDRVAGYTALFEKSELIGNRVVRQQMKMKFRREPFSVYLRCRSRREAGREVIFVAGAHGGNLVLHESGLKAFAGTLTLRPDDPRVMEENRYPITNVGMERMLKIVVGRWQNEKDDPDNVEVRFISPVSAASAECDEIEVTHRRRTAEVEFHQTRLYIDRESKLPVQVEQYGWPDQGDDGEPPLIEEYTYSQIETNVNLTDDDFDPENSAYRFTRLP